MSRSTSMSVSTKIQLQEMLLSCKHLTIDVPGFEVFVTYMEYAICAIEFADLFPKNAA